MKTKLVWPLLGLLLAVMWLTSIHPRSAWATKGFSGLSVPLGQQSTPELFLAPPYYGEATVISIFDHEYPIYTDEYQSL